MTRHASVAVRLWLAVSLTGVALPACAYLDPSTGSMILSAIVGIFATVSLALKTYWYKLKSLFRRPPEDRASPSGQPGKDGGPAAGGQR